MIGQTIAHYRVTEKLGEGGMGEVYRATDTKLGRDVALKVLPEAFLSDPQRMARFEREAQLLASLNHPHIGSIYGLEETKGTRCLVLELIEGPTLAERLREGPLPLEEALTIARQVAEAVEAAHEKGIIHRDLKPGNVKVTPEGTVKVLDFGLAKAFAGEAAEADLSKSPTLSAVATRAGILLGTAAYMSPEHAGWPPAAGSPPALGKRSPRRWRLRTCFQACANRWQSCGGRGAGITLRDSARAAAPTPLGLCGEADISRLRGLIFS